MAYKGQSGHIKELGIFILTNKEGNACFWSEEHACNAIWQDSLQAFAVKNAQGKWEAVSKQPSEYAGVINKDGIPVHQDTGETFWGERDRETPNVLWGAMWWA